MNLYEHPKMEVIVFDSKDVISTSDGLSEEYPEDKNPGIDLPIDKN